MDLAGGALPPIGSGADWKMEETTKASPRGKKRKVGVELFYYLGTGGACCCLTLDRINPPSTHMMCAGSYFSLYPTLELLLGDAELCEVCAYFSGEESAHNNNEYFARALARLAIIKLR